MIELFLATALAISGHPITEWVFDGRDNKITYASFYSTGSVLTIEKQGYIIDTDTYYVDELNIWYYPDNSKELLRLENNLNWQQTTTKTKLEII